MLHPKNNVQKMFRFDIKPVSGNTKITLGNVIHNKPIITKLNDVIQYNNQSINNSTNYTHNQSQIQNLPNHNSLIHNNYSSSSEESTYSTELIESSENEPQKSLNSKESSNVSVSEFSNSKSLEESSSKSTSESSVIPSETKLYWEYGNTGLKIIDFNKKMARNLAIMNYIDQLFNEYNNSNLNNNYQKLFSSSINANYDLNTGKININNGVVNVNLKHSKLTGTYNILEAGIINFSDINLTEKDLKQNSIPNLEQLLTHKDNNYHITKIIKLFNLKMKSKIKSNVSNKKNSFEQMSKNANELLNELVKNNKKNKILKSNKYSGFYIKIYNDCGKGFIIDGKTNILYYVAMNIDYKTSNIHMRYYAFNIKNGKIVKI